MKKYIFPPALILLIFFSWMNVLGNPDKDAAKYEEYIGKAELNEKNTAYITAAEYYAQAAEYTEDNAEIYLLAAENYKKCGEGNLFLKYSRLAAQKAPENDRPWVMMAEFCLERGEAGKAVNLLKEVPSSASTEKISELIADAESRFHKGYKSFSDSKGFYGDYCAVFDGNFWGILDAEGRYQIIPEYDDAGAYSPDEDIIPVCREGKWFFINADNQVRYVPSEKYTWLGSFGSGLAPFCCGGKYGYTDLEGNEKAEYFDYAGPFSEGVAAVQRDGKWALVNAELEFITGFEYDEISADRYGFCVHGGVICAVKDGKNVYIDVSGEETKSERPYLCNLRPVKFGEFMGYENKQGDIVIDAYFDEVTDFSENGRAMVKEDGVWKMISLDVYE